MALNLLPLGTLGAVEVNGAVTFGLWLPWVSAGDGNAVTVKIIHERDQFLQNVPPREFPLTHSLRAPYGDFWSATVPITGTAPGVPSSAWGTPGRYLYRYAITNPSVGTLDWIIDPCAREFGVGKLSAFTLGYQPYIWSAGEAQWRTPPLSDLILYEINIAEFGGDLERIRNVVTYLADLGVNGVEIMPLSNVGNSVDWGYLPIGYFGVDERSAGARISRLSSTCAASTASRLLSTSSTAIPAWISRIMARTRACITARTRSWGLSRRITSATSARAPILTAKSRATTSLRSTNTG